MKLPYGYVLNGVEIVIHEERADIVRSIFEYYLAGASLGKIVDMLFAKGVLSPTGKSKWTRASIDKLLVNEKYIPIVGMKVYLDTQFEKDHRCNVDYDRTGHPRKSTRYQSPSIEILGAAPCKFCVDGVGEAAQVLHNCHGTAPSF